VDDKMDRVIFVVNKGQMGLAIGKGGSTIKQLQNMVAKKIELVEFSDDASEFIRNMLNADMIMTLGYLKEVTGQSRQLSPLIQGKKAPW
jgi:N utilization substance protein A